MKVLPRYYGDGSNRFWGAVRNIKDDRLHDAIYAAGCALQAVEWQVLRALAEALEPPRRKQKKAPKK